MTTLTIELPDDTVRGLQAIAKEKKTTVEQEAAATVVRAFGSEDAAARRKRLDGIMDTVVEENAELYRRLA